MSIEPNNIINYFIKHKVYSVFEETIVKVKSNKEASKFVNLTLSTIKIYKNDLWLKPENKVTYKSAEQINQIDLIGV